jgi:hypothetical protein
MPNLILTGPLVATASSTDLARLRLELWAARTVAGPLLMEATAKQWSERRPRRVERAPWEMR